MTFISSLVFFNNKRQIKKYPLDKFELNETSIVIPVNDNQEGIENYLHALFETHQNGNLPKEVIITANCLIGRNAFLSVNGFDERFIIAGGEDIDLGLRLSRLGHLAYAYESVILHNFDDGIIGYCKRFKRNGKGNKMV